MAIKVNTGQVQQTTVTPKTMGFDPNPSVAGMASRAMADSLQKIGQSIIKQSEIRDKVTANNVLSNYKISLDKSYSGLLDAYASGDDDKITEAQSNWDSLNPDKGIDYSRFSEGGSVSSDGVYNKFGIDNSIKELYATNNLRVSNEKVKQENLITVKTQQKNTRSTLLDLQADYSEVAIPNEEFDRALVTIGNYLNHESIQSLSNEQSIAEWRNDAESMLVGLFEHQLTLTTNNLEKTELLKKWNETVKSDAYANISTSTLVDFGTTVARAKKQHITDLQGRLRDGAKTQLSVTANNLKAITNSDPYAQPNQEDLTNITVAGLELVEFHTSNLSDGVEVLTSDQMSKAESIIALASVQVDQEEDGLSVLDSDIISSIQRQSFNLDAPAKDVIPGVLANADPEYQTEYRTIRNNLITSIKTGLDKGDTRVLEYFTSDQDEQRALLNDLGYSDLTLYKEPITEHSFSISSNREDIDESVLYTRDALRANSLNELAVYAGNLMSNPKKEGDYELGLVYLAGSKAKNKEEAAQITESLIISLGNYKQSADAYNIAMSGADDEIKTVISNVESFATTRESFVADQIKYFTEQGNSQAVQFYQNVQNGAVMDSINSIINNADTSKPWYNWLLLGLPEEKKEAKKRFLVTQFNADKIDSELERLLVTRPAEELIAKIGYYGQADDYTTNVYISPEIFGKGVNTVLYGKSAGYQSIMGDQFFNLPFGIDVVDPVQNALQQLSYMGTGNYTATLKQVENRVVEASFIALSQDSNFIVDDIFTPTDVKAQRALSYSSGREQFYEETKDQLAKIKDYQDDPMALAEHLATITVKDSSGIAYAAFDLSQHTVDENGNVVTQVQYRNPQTRRYEPLNYIAKGDDGNYLLDADDNYVVHPFTISASTQGEILDQIGIGAFEEEGDPSIYSALPAAAVVEKEFREQAREDKNFSNKEE